jgi:hypothetical protein
LVAAVRGEERRGRSMEWGRGGEREAGLLQAFWTAELLYRFAVSSGDGEGLIVLTSIKTQASALKTREELRLSSCGRAYRLSQFLRLMSMM